MIAIIGALLDAVSTAMRNVASTRLAKAPRLADFAKWMTAAEGLKVMARCIVNVFDGIPPERADVPSRDELTEATNRAFR